ncbi:MAG TPA: hypothetical protein VF530_19905 [Planctomycetota bacterium]
METILDCTTLDVPSASSTGAPYVAGNFAPLQDEVTAFDLEVTGRFLRMCPNPPYKPDLVRLASERALPAASARD